MEALSIFDIFKIGVGPSSSHTLGPWKAASHFAKQLKSIAFNNIQVHLFGSLSKTGVGHATDKAIMLGLQGYDARTIVTASIPTILATVSSENQILVSNTLIDFNPEIDIIFEDSTHELHPNTLVFRAFENDKLIHEVTYASIGGGFIQSTSVQERQHEQVKLPYPISKGQDIIRHTKASGLNFAQLVFQNESQFHSQRYILNQVELLLETMLECVYQGCITEGELPGGLQVKRRAKKICASLTNGLEYNTLNEWINAIKQTPKDFNSVSKWVSCFALAVNEQNAAMSRVVTSPTNGAAGVLPAVLLYYYFFCDYKGKKSVRDFLFVAGEIGCLFKKKATISAAEGGCQAEIGVSSAMAAAGLTFVLNGTTEQCLMAAEIAMEHHLGLTCDPVRGLVQVPCIERNAMGAIKAITAANLALNGNPENAIVHLDDVIKTMWDTARDMSHKYKETADGGLAMNISVGLPDC